MNYSKESLKSSAEEGSVNVSRALSKIANTEVKVTISNIESLSTSETIERITPKEDHSVVVYSQVTTGVSGVSIMTIRREDALNLVDILSQQAIGTTGVLKDIDRSAIKEILNILSNAYITAIAKTTKTELELGVPTMITSDRLGQLIEGFEESANTQEKTIIFETQLETLTDKITATLYLVFNEQFSELVDTRDVNIYGFKFKNFISR